MHISIITVGKVHDPNLKDAIGMYETRLSKHARLTWKLVGSSDIQTEGRQIEKLLDGYVVLLDETGHLITTPQLAAKLEGLQNASISRLTFVIGGAYGVTDALKSRADYVWSLSPLVFPHQLVRLLLTEQLYRAYDILAGGRYHHS